MIGFLEAMSDDLSKYPGVTAWQDRHGKTRWRFRRAGKVVYMPGAPNNPEFDARYADLVSGRTAGPLRASPAPVVDLPTSARPRSIAAAWQAYKRTSLGWRSCTPETRAKQETIASTFLLEPIANGADMTWGMVPIADLKRRHLRAILSAMSDRPFAARSRLIVIKKMIEAALDEEWMETDPTFGLKYQPARIKGWRAWTDAERSAFEARWPIGTTARLVYELAFWLGNRRGDVVSLKWEQRGIWRGPDGRDHDVFYVTQGKTKKDMVIPVSPQLAQVLDATPRAGAFVVMTRHGSRFSTKSLTGRMRKWTAAAGLEQGCVIHGLRKTLGKAAAEGGATTRQSMDLLGHVSIQHAELYSRDANQAMLSIEAIGKVVALESRRKKRG